MRLTSFTDFGLRALMRMAGEPDRTFTTDDIAREFDLSRNHLLKVIAALSHHGFVTTQRGQRGGMRLAHPADDISVGAVVRALEQREALVECFRDDGGACVLTPRCRLKRHLADAREQFMESLDKVRLSECVYPAPPA